MKKDSVLQVLQHMKPWLYNAHDKIRKLLNTCDGAFDIWTFQTIDSLSQDVNSMIFLLNGQFPNLKQ